VLPRRQRAATTRKTSNFVSASSRGNEPRRVARTRNNLDDGTRERNKFINSPAAAIARNLEFSEPSLPPLAFLPSSRRCPCSRTNGAKIGCPMNRKNVCSICFRQGQSCVKRMRPSDPLRVLGREIRELQGSPLFSSFFFFFSSSNHVPNHRREGRGTNLSFFQRARSSFDRPINIARPTFGLLISVYL